MTPLTEHFGGHLRELRQRLVISLLTLVVVTGISYLFVEHIVRFLIAPLFHSCPNLTSLVYTRLTEAFVSYLKVALFAGFFFSFPVLLFQAWRFVAPGLLANEKRLAFKIVFWATSLFLAGGLFAYFIALPRMLSFFMGFAGDWLLPMPKLDGYLTFIARTVLAFGLAFEIPFLMMAAVKTNLVAKDRFVKQRWLFYLAIFGLAFLLVAGDVFAAVLLGIPLIGLYEAGILVTRFF
ncbi:MAG: twin arginine-targeting protein translocase TatC [Deltaproteobacteria bacterium RIFOXYD12_FULL_50_9]|nr:MAG: twin arginine-targeting protein translocase TatC [Deltaproteobacteria bacterium RIFOXYD12_FULL_50_9]